MATISQYLKMQDGISSPMLKATKATEDLLNAQERVASAIEQTEDVTQKMANGTNIAASQLGKMANIADVAGESISSMGVDATNALNRLKALGAFQDSMGRWHGSNGKYVNPNNLLTNPVTMPSYMPKNELKPNIPTLPPIFIATKLEQPSNINTFISKLKNSLISQFAIGTMIGNFILGAVEQINIIPSMLKKTSDAYSDMEARLKLVAGSQEKAVELNEMIYRSALKANGSYFGMADAVSKIAMTAKEAFPDPKQVVPFMENVQKLFSIGGTDVEHQADALLQLTQALGSGKLQGDELRSIAEAAPILEQVIADYMDVSMGEIKQLGSEGEITAEIIKNAMLGATDEINQKFATIPLTWDDIWTNIESRTTYAFQPIYKEINKLANSNLVKFLADSVVVGMQIISNGMAGIINNINWITNSISDFYSQNQNACNSIIVGFSGAIAAIGLYNLALTGLAVKTAVLASISSAGKVLQYVTYLPTAINLIRTLGLMQTIATMSAAEMWGAMLLPISAVVAGIYVLTDGFNNLGVVIEYTFSILLGMLTSAGIALGGYIAYLAVYNGLQLLATAYTFAYNTALVVTNASLSIAYARTMAVGIAQRAMAVASLLASGAMAILNATVLANPLLWFIGLITVVIGAFISWKIASNGLRNTLAEVFSTIAETVASAINFMIDRINGLISAFNTIKRASNEFFHTNFSTTGQINWRAEGWGGTAYKAVQDFKFSDFIPDSGTNENSFTMPAIEVPTNIPNYPDGGSAGAGGNNGTAKNTKDTADNTKKIAEAMDILDEDLKFMRDIAEQEVINKYTTAKIEINMENINNISKDVDFDGLITHIGEKIAEATVNGAEAVHI